MKTQRTKLKRAKQHISFETNILEQEKELLLSAISHDIKNHLMSIKGYMHLVSKKVASDSSTTTHLQKVHEKINAISDLMDHLNSLIHITAHKDK